MLGWLTDQVTSVMDKTASLIIENAIEYIFNNHITDENLREYGFDDEQKNQFKIMVSDTIKLLGTSVYKLSYEQSIVDIGNNIDDLVESKVIAYNTLLEFLGKFVNHIKNDADVCKKITEEKIIPIYFSIFNNQNFINSLMKKYYTFEQILPYLFSHTSRLDTMFGDEFETIRQKVNNLLFSGIESRTRLQNARKFKGLLFIDFFRMDEDDFKQLFSNKSTLEKHVDKFSLIYAQGQDQDISITQKYIPKVNSFNSGFSIGNSRF